MMTGRGIRAIPRQTITVCVQYGDVVMDPKRSKIRERRRDGGKQEYPYENGLRGAHREQFTTGLAAPAARLLRPVSSLSRGT